MLNMKTGEDVYPPSEDTFLIAKHIPKDLKGKKVLDLGCGSGMLGIIAAVNGGNVTCSDIKSTAIACTLDNAKRYDVKIKTINTDLFYDIKDKFDLILFNPPYVREDEHSKYLTPGLRAATVSGKRGTALINRFLREFKKYLNKGGKVLMVISSQNEIKAQMKKDGWKEIDSDSFFFEKIFLMEYKS